MVEACVQSAVDGEGGNNTITTTKKRSTFMIRSVKSKLKKKHQQNSPQETHLRLHQAHQQRLRQVTRFQLVLVFSKKS